MLCWKPPKIAHLLCVKRICDTLLMKQLAIRLGEPNTLAKSLVMAYASRLREQPRATHPAPDGFAAPLGAARSVSLSVNLRFNVSRTHPLRGRIPAGGAPAPPSEALLPFDYF